MRFECVKRALLRWILGVSVVAGMILTSGCRDEAEGGYVRLAGKLFIFNYRISTATYVVTLQRLKPIPQGAHLIATFENPANGAPLLVAGKIWPGDAPIAVESEPVLCIKKGIPYAFSVELFFEEKSIQLIEGMMTSTLDQSILPDRPLVIGPGYEPNLQIGNDVKDLLKQEKSDACAN